MEPEERDDFREIVVASCQHVFPQCGLPIAPTPMDLTELAMVPDEEVAGFAGFTADSIRGALTLLTPADLLRQSYPLKLRSGIEGNLELFDWCGEIVNRLLGHLKAGLAVRGVEIEPSTPKAIMGESIRLTVLEKSTICSLKFTCRTGTIAVFVDAVSTGGRRLFHEPKEIPGAAKEGDIVLF